MSDRVKFTTFNGEIVPGRLVQIVSDEVKETPNRNDPTRTFKNRVKEGQIIALLSDGKLVPVIKNMAFVLARFTTVEGLDVIDGNPVHPENLTDMALQQQSERVGAASGASAELVIENS